MWIRRPEAAGAAGVGSFVMRVSDAELAAPAVAGEPSPARTGVVDTAADAMVAQAVARKILVTCPLQRRSLMSRPLRAVARTRLLVFQPTRPVQRECHERPRRLGRRAAGSPRRRHGARPLNG